MCEWLAMAGSLGPWRLREFDSSCLFCFASVVSYPPSSALLSVSLGVRINVWVAVEENGRMESGSSGAGGGHA